MAKYKVSFVIDDEFSINADKDLLTAQINDLLNKVIGNTLTAKVTDLQLTTKR